MASTAPADVIRRLLDDDTIHEQISEAGAGLRDAYRRARHLPPAKAVQDKTVYDRLRQAAGGATEATRRALGKPAPKPKRGGRRALALLILVATGAVVWWAANRDRQGVGATGPSAAPASTPPASGPPPVAPG
jgi:ferric-dicitrate binding protein FerR (iron transport regulator)